MKHRIFLLIGVIFSGVASAKTFECKLTQYGNSGVLVQHTQVQVQPSSIFKSEKFDLNGIRFELRTFESKLFVRVSAVTQPTSYFYLTAQPEDKHLESIFALNIEKVATPIIGSINCNTN